MMFRRRIQIKLFAVFVMAFVCLNASGAACVAYCETFEVTAETEHCPLKKLSEDCDKTNEPTPQSISLDSHEIDCCPMSVSFFGVPVESKSFSFDQVSRDVLPQYVSLQPSSSVLSNTFAANFDYRGPPPLDRRFDRLKHRVFRI